MINSWENAWGEFVPFLEFPVELGHIQSDFRRPDSLIPEALCEADLRRELSNLRGFPVKFRILDPTIAKSGISGSVGDLLEGCVKADLQPSMNCCHASTPSGGGVRLSMRLSAAVSICTWAEARVRDASGSPSRMRCQIWSLSAGRPHPVADPPKHRSRRQQRRHPKVPSERESSPVGIRKRQPMR